LFTPSYLRQEQQRCLQDTRPDRDVKTRDNIGNTSDLDCKKNGSCTKDCQPWQADCDDIVQMLRKEVQHVLGEVGKVSSRLNLLETHTEQMKPSHDRSLKSLEGKVDSLKQAMLELCVPIESDDITLQFPGAARFTEANEPDVHSMDLLLHPQPNFTAVET